jgi:hypothetical protein
MSGSSLRSKADGELLVRQHHVEEALAELLIAGGALTHSLLGAAVKGGSGLENGE